MEECENLQGILTPPALARKNPFWTTTTENDLYGFQIGGDWKIIERGRFSLSGLAKVGMFDNNAAENTGVSMYRKMYWESDTTNQLAFLGEIGLEARYQLTPRLSLKAGYQAISLEGVALCPARSKKPSVTAIRLTPTCKHLVSTAAPACSFTGSPPAWNFRFRGVSPPATQRQPALPGWNAQPIDSCGRMPVLAPSPKRSFTPAVTVKARRQAPLVPRLRLGTH